MNIELLVDKGPKMKKGQILENVFRDHALQLIKDGEALEVTAPVELAKASKAAKAAKTPTPVEPAPK